MLPESLAKPQPEYIPEAIREDYFEACRIRELSPKASAALARRCLQGMIRDFWDIQKGRLIDEILELKNHVESTIWGAIDAVREVGNIGAHMEKDVNLIIDVEPGEAEKILGLIELLLKEWYVARKEREDRVNEVIKIGKEKVEEKKNKQ